jgi:hypothetical protein
MKGVYPPLCADLEAIRHGQRYHRGHIGLETSNKDESAINTGVRLTLLILMHGLENGQVQWASGLLTIKINDTGGGRDFFHL